MPVRRHRPTTTTTTQRRTQHPRPHFSATRPRGSGAAPGDGISANRCGWGGGSLGPGGRWPAAVDSSRAGPAAAVREAIELMALRYSMTKSCSQPRIECAGAPRDAELRGVPAPQPAAAVAAAGWAGAAARWAGDSPPLGTAQPPAPPPPSSAFGAAGGPAGGAAAGYPAAAAVAAAAPDALSLAPAPAAAVGMLLDLGPSIAPAPAPAPIAAGMFGDLLSGFAQGPTSPVTAVTAPADPSAPAGFGFIGIKVDRPKVRTTKPPWPCLLLPDRPSCELPTRRRRGTCWSSLTDLAWLASLTGLSAHLCFHRHPEPAGRAAANTAPCRSSGGLWGADCTRFPPIIPAPSGAF